MRYKIIFSKKFRKSLKRLKHSGNYDPELTANILNTLVKSEPLEEKSKDHSLVGKYSAYRECHIKSDLLLIYRIDSNDSELFIENIGSHSELFS